MSESKKIDDAPPPYQGPPGAYPPQQGGAPPGAYPPGPPPGAYPPQQQAATSTTVITQQAVITSVRFADVPIQCRCPNCHNDVTSNVTLVNGMMVYLAMLIVLLLGFWLGCCLIPLCIDSLKDAEHTCPVCNYQLGRYERLK